jgi:hypothetical protein
MRTTSSSSKTAAFAVAYVPGPSVTKENDQIVQPVRTDVDFPSTRQEQSELLRAMEMSTFDLDDQVRPTVKLDQLGDGTAIFVFTFESIHDKRIIRATLRTIFEEFTPRWERKVGFKKTGPGLAVSGEFKVHG